MGGSEEGAKDEILDSVIGLDEPVSRSDFLKKLVAGGVVSVAALSGLGAMQKAFGQEIGGSSSSISGNASDIPSLIQQVNQLSKQLGSLQTQFANLISGKLDVPEISIIKLTVPESGHIKIDGGAEFLKMHVPETGSIKIAGDATFLKLNVPDAGFIKFDGESTFLKLNVPENGFMKIVGPASFTGDATFVKIEATAITANKISTPTSGTTVT
jgi:hypothetical protein